MNSPRSPSQWHGEIPVKTFPRHPTLGDKAPATSGSPLVISRRRSGSVRAASWRRCELDRAVFDAAHQFVPLTLRGHRSAWYLIAHAVDEVLMIKCQSLGARDFSYVPRRLSLVTGPTNSNQPIRIICILAFGAQGQRRTMIEDNFAQHHPRPAIEAASLLPQRDLRSQQGRQRVSFAASERELALHR
jgi:hypothetical protein